MRTLTVKNFSCIKNATLELEKVTLIIGPQASGKSLLSKLGFFLLNALHSQYNSVSRTDSFEKFSAGIKVLFLEWFPTQAWGEGKFHIELIIGDYSVTLDRKSWKEQQKDDFRIKFSPAFKQQYEILLSEVLKLKPRASEDGFGAGIEFDYRFRETVDQSARALMGKEAVGRQAFIPAGRSFFTSIGKAIAAFEQGRVLDPLILRFGRMYTAYKSQPIHFSSKSGVEIASVRTTEALFRTLLGGRLRQDGDAEFVEMEDGRRVPLSAMSSGQQELLPLMAVMPWLFAGKIEKLCYIEEPEAHLFPESQGRLVEALVVAANAGSTSLVMTTHSPYVVTKLNNLLKAGAIARKLDEAGRKQMEAVMPRRSWLLARGVRAYALDGGILRSILDADGLVDGEYLDSASFSLSDEFAALMDLEARNV